MVICYMVVSLFANGWWCGGVAYQTDLIQFVSALVSVESRVSLYRVWRICVLCEKARLRSTWARLITNLARFQFWALVVGSCRCLILTYTGISRHIYIILAVTWSWQMSFRCIRCLYICIRIEDKLSKVYLCSFGYQINATICILYVAYMLAMHGFL